MVEKSTESCDKNHGGGGGGDVASPQGVWGGMTAGKETWRSPGANRLELRMREGEKRLRGFVGEGTRRSFGGRWKA